MQYNYIMKSITFTCTKSAEQIKKEADQALMYYKIAPFLGIICMGIFVFLFLHMRNQNAEAGDSSSDLLLYVMLGVAFLFMLFVTLFFVYYKNRAGIKYILMPDKQFGWDEDAQQFFYKDKNRSLRFKGDDVKTWNSYIQNNTNIPMDIILLKTGERLVLEGDWNEKVHDYLQNFHNLLGLPKPSSMVWMLDVYKDEPTPDR